MLREEKRLNQIELGKVINVSGQALGMYENEKRDLSTANVIKLAEFFNVSTDYLLGKSDKRNSDLKNDKLFLAPVYGKISAGLPNWAEECLDGYLPIDPNLMNISSPDECFFLRVDGESMNKVLKNGSYALIRKTDFVEDGEIAVVLVNGYDATIKKFTKQGDIIALEPMSDDASIKTQIYTKDIPIKVIGKYIGKMEINER
jgi:repressor LexA